MAYRRVALLWVMAWIVSFAAPVEAQTKPVVKSIAVYQDPGWGCCGAWVGHLQSNGFKVEKKNLMAKKLLELKNNLNVPEKLRSCHTALIDGYIIEGHVPADLIDKLIREKPAVVGLAVPGMPVGSPGMDGGKPEPYNVLSFDKDGKTAVYAKR